MSLNVNVKDNLLHNWCSLHICPQLAQRSSQQQASQLYYSHTGRRVYHTRNSRGWRNLEIQRKQQTSHPYSRRGILQSMPLIRPDHALHVSDLMKEQF